MTYLVYKWLKQEEKTCMSSRGGTFTILSSQLGLVRHIYLIPQCFWKILKILMFWFQWVFFHHLNIVSFLLMTIFSSAARYSKGKMNLGFYVLNSVTVSNLFAQKCKNVFLSLKNQKSILSPPVEVALPGQGTVMHISCLAIFGALII